MLASQNTLGQVWWRDVSGTRKGPLMSLSSIVQDPGNGHRKTNSFGSAAGSRVAGLSPASTDNAQRQPCLELLHHPVQSRCYQELKVLCSCYLWLLSSEATARRLDCTKEHIPVTLKLLNFLKLETTWKMMLREKQIWLMTFFSFLFWLLLSLQTPTHHSPILLHLRISLTALDGFLCLWQFRAHPSGKTCYNGSENSPRQEGIPVTLP